MAESSTILKFDPECLRLNKRHTKILGTLNKKTTNAMLGDFIVAGMDGIRVFCDDGHETCKRLIDTAREVAVAQSRRIVVCIELRCKSIERDYCGYRAEEDVRGANRKRPGHAG
jgi:hypothetical protein